MRILKAAAMAALGLLLAAGAAAAQDYPTKPVRIIVGYVAGGGSDALSRPFAERLSEKFGQQFVLEHRGGAGAAIATEAVAKSAPDGQTLLFATSGPMTVLPHLRKMPYASDDVVPVARVGEIVAGMTVHPSLGVKTLAEFVALAKQKPGQIAYASAGIASVTHLRGEMFNKLAGLNMLHVPYKGNGEALADHLSGTIQVMFEVTVLPHAKAGKLNLLATLADQRNPEFPDTPTIKEAGYPDYDVPLWFGLFAPKGTPPAIIKRLNAAVVEIAQRPEVITKMRESSYILHTETPEQMKALVDRENATFGKLIAEAGIKME